MIDAFRDSYDKKRIWFVYRSESIRKALQSNRLNRITGIQHPLYLWLTSKSDNGVENSDVSWNFQKYMIDDEGQLVGHFEPKVKPDNKKLVSWIDN